MPNMPTARNTMIVYEVISRNLINTSQITQSSWTDYKIEFLQSKKSDVSRLLLTKCKAIKQLRKIIIEEH